MICLNSVLYIDIDFHLIKMFSLINYYENLLFSYFCVNVFVFEKLGLG